MPDETPQTPPPEPEPPPPTKHAVIRRRAAMAVAVVAILAAVGLAGREVFAQLLPKWQNWAFAVGLVPNWRPPLLLTLVVLAVAVILLLWKLPKWQAANSAALTDDKKFDRENEARKTLAQIIGGVFLLAGLYSSTQTLDLAREGQITDRFTKAVEQLGATDSAGKPKIEVRLGGIYALERIARDSPKDHPAIMEVLTAYVRENLPIKVLAVSVEDAKTQKPSKANKTEAKAETPKLHRLSIEIEAILKVLARRNKDSDRRDAGGPPLPLDLEQVKFREAELSGFDLSGLDLDGASLFGADLNGAYLNDAHLFGADLRGAHLDRADLRGAIGLVPRQVGLAYCNDDTNFPDGFEQAKNHCILHEKYYHSGILSFTRH